MSSFTQSLLDRVGSAVFKDQAGNIDTHRFAPPTLKSRAYSVARAVTQAIGFGPYSWTNSVSPKAMEKWSDSLGKLEWLYKRFEDDESRRWLVDIVAYRLMGHRAIKLPLNTPAYWKRTKEIEAFQEGDISIPFGFMEWTLNRFDLKKIGYPIKINTRVANIMAQFELEQYACDRIGVRVKPGFKVIDGGGCFGDTALYFAHLAGNTGKVYSFEFVDSNLELYQKNLDLNPNIADQIQICRHPLWSTSDQELYVNDRGPASTISPEPEGEDSILVKTLAIDDLVTRESLDKVDFIKMDIEGAEFESLKGAEQTIRKFRPQLAICVYHSPQDFHRLAELINSYDPEYRFALGHFTIHSEETILFAKHKNEE